MIGNNHDVGVLNTVITTTIDSIDGYREAAENINNARLQSIFLNRANERQDVVQQLQTHVRSMGEEPSTDGSALAGTHRFLLRIRDALTGSDEDAVIAEVERGEDYLKEKYEAAIADTELSAQCRAILQNCYSSVRAGHDQISALKHGMSGGTGL